MKNLLFVLPMILIIALIACQSKPSLGNNPQDRIGLADSLENLLKTNLVDKWYPAAIDTLYGGYLSTFDKDFRPTGNQNKMIVSRRNR